MGGHAFPDLSTPRVPANVYFLLKEHILASLSQHYRYADVPVEGPGKTDYGDLDILVTEPLKSEDVDKLINHPEPVDLAMIINAPFYKKINNSDTVNLAIPWPDDEQLTAFRQAQVPARTRTTSTSSMSRPRSASHPDRPRATSLSSNASTSSRPHLPTPPPPEELYIQVDIQILPDRASQIWLLFQQAHGDLWSILGHSLYPYGLTHNKRAFFLRIPEVAGMHRDLERVKASSDPSVVLKYLELDESKYWKQFTTKNEMMEYVARNRFHDPTRGSPRQKPDEDPTSTPSSGMSTPLPSFADLNIAPGSASTATLTTNKNDNEEKLRSSDRRRAKTRPVFDYWLSTYRPAHIHDPRGRSAHLSREQVVEDAKAFFGANFAGSYDDQKARALRHLGLTELWPATREKLKVMGVSNNRVSLAMKGIKRLLEGDMEGAHVPGLAEARRAFEESKWDEVLEWAVGAWEPAAELEKVLEKARKAQGEKGG